MEKYCQSSYLMTGLKSEASAFAVETIKKIIEDKKLDFDTIVFRGMSGALLAPLLAFELKKELLMIRKKDGNHSGLAIEGNLLTKRYIILDDLISSGGTMQSIFSAMYTEGAGQAAEEKHSFDLRNAECVGIILYHDRHREVKRRFDFLYDFEWNTYGKRSGFVEAPVYAFRVKMSQLGAELESYLDEFWLTF